MGGTRARASATRMAIVMLVVVVAVGASAPAPAPLRERLVAGSFLLPLLWLRLGAESVDSR